MDKAMLDMLQMEDLHGETLLLAQTVGMEAFRKLVTVYGGTGRLYIPQPEMLVIPIRDKRIREEYNGSNLYELCEKWHLSESYMRNIVREKSRELRLAPVSGQIGFEELVEPRRKTEAANGTS